MAGAGYKLFNTGDVLTAAQVNTYLQEQTVMVFASSTARTTALSGVLAEGMMSYLQDINSVEVYNGSSWVALASGDVTEVQAGTGISVASGTGPIPVVTNTMATTINAAGDLIYGTANDTFTRLGIGTAGQVLKVNSGATAPEWGAASAGALTLITRTSYSNVASQTFDNVFTTTYKTYLIIVETHYAATVGDSFEFIFRYGTTDATAHYGNTLYSAVGTTPTAAGTSNQASLKVNIASGGSTYPLAAEMLVHNVGTGSSIRPQIYGQGLESYNTRMFSFGGYTDNLQNHTGFKVKSSSSNITGTIAVYGYGV